MISLKNPGDNIDFEMSWTNIGTALLSSVVHSVDASSGLTVVSQSNTGTTSLVRLSGAVHGGVYLVTGTATLDTGRTLVRPFPLRVFNG